MAEQHLFPGFEGIPFRSNGTAPPNLKSDDPDKKQPQIVLDAKVKIFDLAEPEQLKAYEQIWFQIGRGVYKFSAEEREYVPETKSWRVFIRYSECYFELPKE